MFYAIYSDCAVKQRKAGYGKIRQGYVMQSEVSCGEWS